jgi:uncharacterized protein (DUF488 family)|tara:strand:+ start:725 stop:1273 length:549 start_codon:yes stop_codon:yes gene_type:complete
MNKSLFSIGHGNTGYEDSNLNKFIDLLNHFKIETLVDVRSVPTSSFASWFNKEYLKKELQKNNIDYKFAGDYLGGRPKGKEFYDDEGYVLYNKLSASDKYQEGLTRLVEIASNKITVMMCSEKDFQKCHRSNLISKTLGNEWEIIHIISKSETHQHELEKLTQLTLDGEDEWKSTRPVSPNG